MIKFIRNGVNSVAGYFNNNTKKANLLLIGLDFSGKSTFINVLTPQNQIITLYPFYELKTPILINKILFWFYKIKNRKITRNELYKNVKFDAIIFLVDCSDENSLEKAKAELEFYLNDPNLSGVPLAFVGNKIDKEKFIIMEELKVYFDLDTMSNTRTVRMFMVSAYFGTGVQDIIDWISDKIKYKII